MKLKVLGSSSSGNCYLLESKNECLMLEAGVRFENIQAALQYDIKKIVGCLITHEHKDHCKYVDSVLKAAISVYTSCGTIEALPLQGHRIKPVEPLKRYQAGGFTIIPFPAEHDAKEPLGFLIHHAYIGNLLFATDTYFLRNRFSGLNHIMIECNYDEEILDKRLADSSVSSAVRDRLLSSHMSLDTCIETLQANDLRKVNTITLIHLSRQNGNSVLFKDAVAKATGKPVYVAEPGMVIDIGRDAF